MSGDAGAGRREEIVCHTTLRGIAALMVVLYHCELALPQAGPFIGQGLIEGGYLFVDLFFVLSGFILARIYGPWFETADGVRDGYATFMARRFARIYPNYFVWLVIAALAAFAIELKATGTLRLGGEEALSFAMHVAMVQSLLGAPVMWNVPLWSIAVEMIAYLAFPPLALVQARGGGRMFVFGPVLALAGLTLLSETLTLDVVNGWPSVLRCLGGFLLGLSISGRTPDDLPALAPRLSAVQAAAFAGAFASAAAGLEIAAVACFALLVFATSVNRGVLYQALRLRPLHYAGEISFSIYLAHVPVLNLWLAGAGRLEAMTGIPFVSDLATLSASVVGLTLAAAALSWRFLERPGRAWLELRLRPASRRTSG